MLWYYFGVELDYIAVIVAFFTEFLIVYFLIYDSRVIV